jgi:hypothetical protein
VRVDPLDMHKLLTISAAAALLLAGTAQGAAAGSYSGTTKAGNAIRFQLAGKQVRAISTGVPTVCLETTGSGQSRAGVELFQPPGAFALGKTAKARALQPAAMNQGIRATKNYTVTTKPAAGGRISGRLQLSFSFLRPGFDIYHSYIYMCTGSTTFSATPR